MKKKQPITPVWLKDNGWVFAKQIGRWLRKKGEHAMFNMELYPDGDANVTRGTYGERVYVEDVSQLQQFMKLK